jgi:formylglycine-generating enzyme required for sulfatase activity
MGSPESEAGRWSWEGPQHRVELTQGFWLADTPCTQGLWAEVMGKNPSRFQSPTRPVEQVSWEDCQEFCRKLVERLPDFPACLPTEAQWEYACRAGTVTATWLGDLEILGERNAPLLDEVAWYGGNSGVDFDLDEGVDSSGWPDKQYPHKKAGTRQVKTRKPNPWGLYDMLGNVFEWCEDAWDVEPYSGDDRVDPVGKDGSGRVLRGGSWGSSAQRVRSAFRNWRDPGLRYWDYGFRLSSGPVLRS